ncbi:Transcriptional regulator, TetR family OS=Tsukamurella paurometabola (strain ATCC 8368 / DSM/ CCUG 35730 / CIP 100753 / JCM 10117 / KCTC 9821 / NBRC 16120/ NCIMB 702349 / NCTC 13040) OX=521096 GN=Tpau_3943 PE=4 SV=1 [Tsukamurella paurometabola]|uniref:Transcriptional regulator, TetR family n=1 Tax=Tsukamurella paurometabola (strain ATCC 8368 / DSM 20162 / CCUG 35730 / CIP 100753 / JCM 10117 / KCTC 9821 / NBRC 16120 / NCIMB 702349 / NCTC 13040) TaxID=521096 RepID=D5UMP1_TSUPD|nr:TetR/AcrR family transcriptional regulator [Tsukamurella paurometabola]ADG80515.1 transcriptional regulator, TetR family [Tsukamurella paurometabola DSM 20162]SUP39930.1 Fatty acid metabolism regulator protein [Tsukamurella paurometabola]
MAGSRETRSELRRKPSQGRAKDTVERAKSAARQILAESGYGALSMGAIADRAEVSKGTVYQYFPNKESVVAALVAEIMDDLVESFGGRLRETLAVGSLSLGPELLTSVFAELDRHRPTLTAVLDGAPHLLPPSAFDPISERWGDATRTLLAIGARGPAEPGRARVDGDALVTILSVCGPALCLHYLSADLREQREALARTYFSMAYGGLTAAGLGPLV